MHAYNRYLAIINTWNFNYSWQHRKYLTCSYFTFYCSMYLNCEYSQAEGSESSSQQRSRTHLSPRVHISRRLCSNCISLTLKKGLNIVLIFENVPPPNKTQLTILIIKVKSKKRSKNEMVLYRKVGIHGEFFWC